jgi:hypothetical protein
MQTHDATLVVAVRSDVVGDRTVATMSAIDAPATRDRARLDHTTSFLGAAITSGAITTDSASATAVIADWHAQLSTAVSLEAGLVVAADLLDDAAIDWRLTKGPALAHLDYDDPAMRCFGDIDLVIHPAHWTRALAVLRDAGMRRETPELAPGYDDKFGKGATLCSASGLEFDLHRRLAIGRFGVRAAMEDLFTIADHIELAGRRIPCLDGPGRLLHACYHVSLGGFSGLRARRDVAQLVLVTAVDWRRTVAIASGWDGAAVIVRAITDTWSTLDLDTRHPAHRWARAQRVGRADMRALGVFGADGSFRAQALTALGALPLRWWPSYLVALATPRLARGRR